MTSCVAVCAEEMCLFMSRTLSISHIHYLQLQTLLTSSVYVCVRVCMSSVTSSQDQLLLIKKVMRLTITGDQVIPVIRIYFLLLPQVLPEVPAHLCAAGLRPAG